MRRSVLIPSVLIALAVVLVACGGGGTAAPTSVPTPSAPPVQPSANASAGPVDSGVPGSAAYDITIPSSWQSFDLSDPSAKAALDAYVAANPSMAASIKQFETIPGVRMAINPLLGNVMLVFTTPSSGIPLDLLAQTFTAQFQAVPGLQDTPKPENVTLPGGDAVHWTLALTSNKPGGGTVSVEESIYLFANSTYAAVVEFVTPSGGAIPDEQAIVGSFKFK